jgi:hypothetical protein
MHYRFSKNKHVTTHVSSQDLIISYYAYLSQDQIKPPLCMFVSSQNKISLFIFEFPRSALLYTSKMEGTLLSHYKLQVNFIWWSKFAQNFPCEPFHCSSTSLPPIALLHFVLAFGWKSFKVYHTQDKKRA